MLAAVIILGLISLLAMGALWRTVRETTLVAPWCWGLASGLAVWAVAIQGASDALLQYMSGVATLLPAVAVYGAKRPQDRGWQWIVAALFVTLLWPAGESWLLERKFDLADQPLRSWFLVVLVAVQCGNWIVTSNAGPILLLSAAQAAMLWPQLPWADNGLPSANAWLYGATILPVVPWWLAFHRRRKKQATDFESEAKFPSDSELAEWKQFRAGYGVVWALRVTERINEVAKARDWPWHWSWAGPVATDKMTASNEECSLPPLLDVRERAVWQQLWDNIFRRFLIVRHTSRDRSTEIESQ